MSGFSDFIYVAKREFYMIFRTKQLFMVVAVAPFLYAVLMFFVYNKHTLYDLPTAAFVAENSQASRTLLRMIEGSPKLKIVSYVNSIEELKDLMLRGKIDAGIVIPPDFSTRLKRGKDSTVTAYTNAATLVSANMATAAITSVVQTFSAGVEIKSLMKSGANSETAQEKFMPVKLDMRPMFNPSFNYTNFMFPGLLTTILQQVILLAVALSWAGELERGSLRELFALSKSPLVLMLGKAFPYIFFNGVVAAIFFGAISPLANVPQVGDLLTSTLFTLLFVLTVVFWGMWFSGLCRTQLAATQALMFVALPSFILSGFTWPLSGMPEFLQLAAQFLPITHFVNAFRTLSLAGVPFEYMIPACSSLFALLIFNLVMSWFVVRRLVGKFSVG